MLLKTHGGSLGYAGMLLKTKEIGPLSRNVYEKTRDIAGGVTFGEPSYSSCGNVYERKGVVVDRGPICGLFVHASMAASIANGKASS